jgi:hypothetical protein
VKFVRLLAVPGALEVEMEVAMEVIAIVAGVHFILTAVQLPPPP